MTLVSYNKSSDMYKMDNVMIIAKYYRIILQDRVIKTRHKTKKTLLICFNFHENLILYFIELRQLI